MPNTGVRERYGIIKGLYEQAMERLFGLRKRQRDIIQRLNTDLESRKVERIRKRLSTK